MEGAAWLLAPADLLVIWLSAGAGVPSRENLRQSSWNPQQSQGKPN